MWDEISRQEPLGTHLWIHLSGCLAAADKFSFPFMHCRLRTALLHNLAKPYINASAITFDAEN